MSLFEKYSPNIKKIILDNVHVRRASLLDVDSIAKIRAQRESDNSITLRDRIKKQILEEQKSVTFIAEYNSTLIGYGRLQYIEPLDAPTGWYLMGLTVTPEHRRRGVGEMLTHARLDLAKNLCKKLYFFTNARNLPSIDLHKQLGFVEVDKYESIMGIHFEGGQGILFSKYFP